MHNETGGSKSVPSEFSEFSIEVEAIVNIIDRSLFLILNVII